MAEAKERLSVLLDDPTQLATALLPIARVVANVLEEHPTDVAQRVRYGGGIVVRDVAEPYAREVARGLAAMGHGSFLVGVGELQAPPRPRRIGTLEFSKDGLKLAQRLREAEPVRWSDVLAVHAHAILEPRAEGEEQAHARRGGDLTRLGEAAKRLLADLREVEDRERSRVVLGLDLLLAGPVLYRLASDDAGIYGSLPDRSTIALENYLKLVELLPAAAPPTVLVSKATRRFVQTKDLGALLVAKREELEAFTSWTMAALSAGVAFGGDDAEELSDDGLEDAEEAVPAAPDEADAGEDIDDASLEPGSDHDEGDEGEGDDDDDDPLENSVDDLDDEDLDDDDLADGDGPVTGADTEVVEAAALFEKTGRLRADDVKAVLRDAKDLDALGEAEVDAEVREAAGIFDASSGRWDVKQVLAGDELDEKDLESADPDAGKA